MASYLRVFLFCFLFEKDNFFGFKMINFIVHSNREKEKKKFNPALLPSKYIYFLFFSTNFLPENTKATKFCCQSISLYFAFKSWKKFSPALSIKCYYCRYYFFVIAFCYPITTKRQNPVVKIGLSFTFESRKKCLHQSLNMK